MSMRVHLRSAVAILVLMLVLAAMPGVASGVTTGESNTGTLEISFTTPVAGTALVEIGRVNATQPLRTVVHDLAKPGTANVELAAGEYRITPRVMVVDDQRYVGRSDPMQVTVTSGRITESTVKYAWSKGVQNLRATEVTGTSIALDWDAELGAGTSVWRVEGDEPVTRPGAGTRVQLSGSSLTDRGLEPGTTYTYSIFVRPGDGAFGRTDGDPVTMTVGTTPIEGSGEPAFVLNPSTIILSADDIAAAVPTGDGLRLDLQPNFRVPVPGTFLSVPVSQTLEGGYLGEVVRVSEDGRSVWLVPAAMGAAFDFYHLAAPEFTDATAAAVKDVSAASFKQASKSIAPDSLSAAALAKVECSGSSEIDVTSSVSLSHAGHAEVTVDKHKILFVEVPSGVAFDVGYSATLKGTLDIEGNNAIECGFPLPNFTRTFATYPVPMLLQVRPEVGVKLEGAGAVSDLGFAATLGFQADGYMGFTGDNYFDGDLIKTGSPTQPTAQGSLSVGVEVGGAVAFGPGVGTSGAGVVIGVGGELFLVDASVGVVEVDDGSSVSTCIEVSAATRVGLFVTLRAWLPGYEYDFKASIDPLQGEFPWGGSPWHWPDDCTESDTPTNDVVGDGVTVIDDDLVGSSDQWGKVDGFVPGQNTWVLSTGRIQDAVGSPSTFASTSLGHPGDAQLTALSGFRTYDAAAFTVRVIPNEDTLKVRYVFASEEYPEYVGSSFNDVMAVFVDGKNCALVPGTTTPVAINTINAWSHSQYYVDNVTGAAGYGTTMDGLTKPLTCSVPVTPGEPVTIKIAVSDASDSIYDSAVALLDGGIWSE